MRNQDSGFARISQARDSGYSAAVTEGATESSKADALAEIERLREKIAGLEERVRLLDQLAHQDSLLELPNRRGFLRELDRLIDRSARYGDSAALLFVDIDGLKRINDTYGHKAGDVALAHVAALLGQGVRKSDFVARLGGDEFGILLVHSDWQSARDTARRLARQIESCEARFEDHRLPLGVAIGVTLIEKGDSADSVIARADHAMYREKTAA